MTSTLYNMFLTKRFCQRVQKMLAAEGIVSAFKVHICQYGHPYGQDLGINFNCAKDIDTINAVFKAYKAKYSRNSESDFNLQAINDGIALTWDLAFGLNCENYWTAHTNSILADGEFKPTYKLATKFLG